MAKNTVNTPKPKHVARGGEVQFINYDLTPDDKRRFKAWAHENAGMDLFTIMDEVAEQNLNFSVKYDTFEGCFAAFLIPTPANEKLKGWLLAGRGSTAFSAVAGVLFRHLVLFEGDWPLREDRKRSVDDDFE